MRRKGEKRKENKRVKEKQSRGPLQQESKGKRGFGLARARTACVDADVVQAYAHAYEAHKPSLYTRAHSHTLATKARDTRMLMLTFAQARSSQWITGGKIHPRNQGRTSWGYTYKCCKPGCSCCLPPAF